MSERECILLVHHNQKDITQIVQALERSKCTLSRELQGNTRRHGYSAYEAQNSYTIRRWTCKLQLKVMRPEHHKHIISELEQYWSPEQIIGHYGMGLGPATIYWALKSGMLPTVLRETLKQQEKTHKVEGEERRGTIPDCMSKGERPAEAGARSHVDNWEGDTVAGKWRTECLMTLVDRKARFLLGKKLDNHYAETLKESTRDSLKVLHCYTLTVDNGKEFSVHKVITAESRVPVCLAHPHSPWKRPTNENTKGLLRQFFPKDTSFLTVSQEHLDHATHLLNNRSQKCLNWKRPHQALAEELLHLV